jgi:hypothetical protein
MIFMVMVDISTGTTLQLQHLVQISRVNIDVKVVRPLRKQALERTSDSESNLKVFLRKGVTTVRRTRVV